MQKYTGELIKEIVKCVDIVEYIGQYIDLKRNGGGYMGICPFHDDTDASLSVTQDKGLFHCFGCGAAGNIIHFVQKYHKMRFPEAIEYLIKYTKIDPTQIKQESALLKVLRQFNTQQKKDKAIERIPLPANVMNKYTYKPIQEWLSEGIKQSVMDKYQVRYDPRDNRAVFPIYDNEGNIINVKGRTLYPNYKDLGIRKYTYYHKLGTNDFLYPLHTKREHIKAKNEVIVLEGEKSVWKTEGWGVNNTVALCTRSLNDYQLKTLLELHCNVVIALDKDMALKSIKYDDNYGTLIRMTNVYVMYDAGGLLSDSDSPCDKGKDVWNRLYNQKIRL